MAILVGRTALVTGGAGNIGTAIVSHLLAAGANVLVFDADPERCALAAEALPADRTAIFVGNVTDASDVDSALALAQHRFGPVQMLVNDAGWVQRAPIVETLEEDWDRMYDVNVKGTFLCTRAYGRTLIAAGLPGAIVNLSSLNYQAATDGMSAYCSAKAAVSQFTKVAAAEFGPHDIRVNAVAPGLTGTPMSGRRFLEGRMGQEFLSRTPLGRFGEPEDVARVVTFLMSTEAGWITGVTLSVDGGAHIRGLHNFIETIKEETTLT